jgi:hypothetical protein
MDDSKFPTPTPPEVSCMPTASLYVAEPNHKLQQFHFLVDGELLQLRLQQFVEANCISPVAISC